MFRWDEERHDTPGASYFHPGTLDPVRPQQPIGVSIFERSVQTLPGPRIENQHRLRELVRDHGDEVTTFSAHNAAELRALQNVRA